jgi:hypothetical protein
MWPLSSGLGIKTTLVALQGCETYFRTILALKILVKGPVNIPSPFYSTMGYIPSVPGALQDSND